jgi:cell division protein FtsB
MIERGGYWIPAFAGMTEGRGQGMRITAFIFPLLALGAGGYFAYHLHTGDHGLQARADLERRKEVLEGELAGLREIKTRIERDVALLRPESLDPDMLDERARAILNLAHPDDLILLKRRHAAPDATRALPKR